ncbi:MAG TPA: MFS transporter [Selenomonadales bacterium]|nr:MFS transporter [Selenomonadales bacterium]
MSDFPKTVGASVSPTPQPDKMKQFFVLILAVSVFGFGTLGLYKPVLAPYLKSLGYDAAAIGFTVGLLGLSKSLTNIPAGFLSDRYGRKPVMIIGLIIFGLCYPFYVISKNIVVLSMARLLNGMGNSAAAQPAMTSVADLLGKRRAFGMGIFESMNYLAISGTTILAGYLAAKYGMTAPFFLGLPMCLFGAYLVYRYVPETKPSAPVAASAAENAGAQSSGEVWKTLLAKPAFSTMCYLGFMTKMVDEGILITLIPLVAAAYGLNVVEIAGIIATGYVTFSMIQPVTGWLSDHLGRRPVFLLGLLILLASALAFPHARTYLFFSVVVIVMKIGNALLYPSLPAAAADFSPAHFRGTGLSVYRTFRDAGVFGGPMIAGFALQLVGKDNAFYFVAGLFTLGLLLTAVFFRDVSKEQASHQ